MAILDDPLTREFSESFVANIIKEYGIPLDSPVIHVL